MWNRQIGLSREPRCTGVSIHVRSLSFASDTGIGGVAVWWEYITKNVANVRDIVAIVGGAIGLGLLFWRSRSADRQASWAQQQAETSRRQVRVAEGDSLAERYRNSVDMLSSENMATRLVGDLRVGPPGRAACGGLPHSGDGDVVHVRETSPRTRGSAPHRAAGGCSGGVRRGGEPIGGGNRH